MKFLISKEFSDILIEIHEKALDLTGWRAIESSDMFQTGHFCGGFDATENAFCFSFYEGEKEYWFQFTLDDVAAALNDQPLVIQFREAEK